MAVKVKARAQITIQFIVDVKATYRYYLLQSSNLGVPSKPTTFSPSSPPSGWDDTEPSYTEESTNSLYFVDCTVFCDDTFQYSEVSLSSSYEAAKKAYNKAKSAIEIADGITMSVSNGIPGNKASIVLKVGNKEYSGTIDLTGAVTFSDLSTSGKTSINGGNIITNSITADQIASKAITTGKIASKAIKTSKIASGAITADKIASETITADKIASGTITADKVNIDDIFSKNITATGQIQFKNNKYELSIDPDSEEIIMKSFSEMKLNGSPVNILSDGAWITLSSHNGINLEYVSGDITINKKPLKSFIVESGTGNGWTYRKWSNGIAECWYNKTISGFACNTALTTTPGSWYRTGEITANAYPLTFSSTPNLQTTFETFSGTGGLVWSCGTSSSTPKTKPANIYIIRMSSAASISGVVHYYAKGNYSS